MVAVPVGVVVEAVVMVVVGVVVGVAVGVVAVVVVVVVVGVAAVVVVSVAVVVAVVPKLQLELDDCCRPLLRGSTLLRWSRCGALGGRVLRRKNQVKTELLVEYCLHVRQCIGCLCLFR